MAEYAFIGDPNDKYSGLNQVNVRGIEFIKNTVSSVPSALEPFFKRHTHFCSKAELSKFLQKQSVAPSKKTAVAKEEPLDPYANMTITDLREAIIELDGTYDGTEDDAALIVILKDLQANHQG